MFDKAKRKFTQIRPYLPAICFFGGFTWDNLTLKRVDNTLDMIIFGCYLILCGAAIVLIARGVKFKFSHYLPLAVQFFFGGLFSSFVVYYFKSSSSLPSLLFMLFLLVLLAGNEFIEKKLHDVTLASTLYAVACFMYLNAIVPVLVRHMNAFTFLLAIALALGVFALARKLSRNPTVKYPPVIGIYATLIVLYFLNVIPPVPLSKKHLAIFRHIHRNNDTYCCTVERPPLWAFLKSREKKFRYASGDTAFCFSSVFAPTELKKKIYHHWYYRDPRSREFSETDRMGYRLIGGRADGYRGYTFKQHLQPGEWKVVLKTSDNKTLGITRFKVVLRDTAEGDIRTKTLRR